jgi:RimJ/RimL family protein N-acetyltransferase
VTVADAWQGKGVSSLLARELLDLVDAVHQIDTSVLLDNTAALRLLQGLGTTTVESTGGAWRVRVALEARRAVA